MNDWIELWEKPASGKYMIAGWHQWEDAGDVSSGLPRYLIDETHARKIGEIKPDGFYLFQIPGTHHLVRPVVKLNAGHREEFRGRRNEFFYSGDEEKGFLIFLGEEPHQNEEQYADAFFDAVEELGVKRVAAVAGLHGPVPYDKDRDVSCVYSLPEMKGELTKYTVRFSKYEGRVTIGTYLAHRAEARRIELFTFCALVPAYDFSNPAMSVKPVRLKRDFQAWYELMRRLNHAFNLDVNLSDLERRSKELTSQFNSAIDLLARKMPKLAVRAYMEKVNKDFSERPFVPLSDVWKEELGKLLEDL